MAEVAALRKHLGKDLLYKVVKNTIARKASEGTQYEVASASLKGPVSITFGFDDPANAVKKVIEYSKKNEKLQLTGGVIDGKFFNADEMKVVAGLPPRIVMLGMMAGMFAAPLSKAGYGLTATVGRLANAMNALKDKKEKEQAA